MLTVEDLMWRAIEAARQGIAAGQSPFGCVVMLDGQILAECHNTVRASIDITAHAEINALRAACQRRGEFLLEGAIVATTCEPCPMCMAALHWARVARVYYGAGITDAQAVGFNELALPAAELLRLGRSSVVLVPGILSLECRELFLQWRQLPGRRAY